MPDFNVRVGRYELDALWRDYRLAVEIDTYGTHGGRVPFELDRVRDAALSGLGRQKDVFFHFYYEEDGDLAYAFSKEISNGEKQRGEAKKILKMARDAYAGTPEERRSFRSAVGLAERQFESLVSEPDAEDEG